MPELDIQDDYQAIVVDDFRLIFRWSGDRWTHELEFRGKREPRYLAWSFETAPEHEEPTRVVSPAFQQLNFQSAGEKIQALLVGQSGPHHFSAVFEVEGRDGSGAAIKVEVADRCRNPVSSLASTYRVAAMPGELLSGGPLEMTWGLGTGLLTFTAPSPAQVAFAEDGRRATRIQAVAEAPAGQSTHRWTYHWGWQPDLRTVPSS